MQIRQKGNYLIMALGLSLTLGACKFDQDDAAPVAPVTSESHWPGAGIPKNKLSSANETPEYEKPKEDEKKTEPKDENLPADEIEAPKTDSKKVSETEVKETTEKNAKKPLPKTPGLENGQGENEDDVDDNRNGAGTSKKIEHQKLVDCDSEYDPPSIKKIQDKRKPNTATDANDLKKIGCHTYSNKELQQEALKIVTNPLTKKVSDDERAFCEKGLKAYESKNGQGQWIQDTLKVFEATHLKEVTLEKISEIQAELQDKDSDFKLSSSRQCTKMTLTLLEQPELFCTPQSTHDVDEWDVKPKIFLKTGHVCWIAISQKAKHSDLDFRGGTMVMGFDFTLDVDVKELTPVRYGVFANTYETKGLQLRSTSENLIQVGIIRFDLK